MTCPWIERESRHGAMTAWVGDGLRVVARPESRWEPRTVMPVPGSWAPPRTGRIDSRHGSSLDLAEIVGKASGDGREAVLVELVDQRLQSLFGVAWVDRVIQGLPVGVLDAFALSFGQLRVEVARAVHAATLAISLLRRDPALRSLPPRHGKQQPLAMVATSA